MVENQVKISSQTKGVENPAATDDDGANLKTDVVISVQPQSQEGGARAVLPVATVDWQSAPRHQFLPNHGLDFLRGASCLLVQQTVELNELSSRIESQHRYIVKVPRGEALYIASEVSAPLQRCLCGAARALRLHLHDATRQEALQLHRRLAAAGCCFPCRLQEMRVVAPPGDYLGRVQQRWAWLAPLYLVRDAADDVLFAVEGPAGLQRGALVQCEFKILSADTLREVGRVSHGWDRALVSFTTTLHAPAHAPPAHKALLLAATFLLEYTHFERAKTSCMRCNCF